MTLLSRDFLAVFIPLALAIVAGGHVLRESVLEEALAPLRRAEFQYLSFGVGALVGTFAAIEQDVRVLARSSSVRHGVTDPTEPALERMAADFRVLAESTDLYDQIRWIDETGMERVRINVGRDGQANRVRAAALQDKSGRYYFSNTIALEDGQIYVSPLDLNIEEGEIEKPIKPVLRFGTPIYDRAGNGRGIVVINYKGQKLINAFVAATNRISDHVILLNGEGHWLFSPNAGDAWGFMFGRTESFATRYPEVWRTLQGTDSIQFSTEAGLWTAITVNPGHVSPGAYADALQGLDRQGSGVVAEEDRWFALSHLPANRLADAGHASTGLLSAGVAILLIGAASLTYAIAKSEQKLRASQAKALQDQKRLIQLLNRAGRVANVGGWELELASGKVSWSDQTYRIHDLDTGTLVDLPTALSFFPPDVRPRLEAALAAASMSGSPYDMELPFISADGQRLWVRVIGEAEQQAGRTIRLFGAIADITDRKRAEVALQESETLTRTVMDSLSSPIAVLDITGRIIRVNEAWRAFACAEGGSDATILGIGQNYFEITAAAAGEADAERALMGMKGVLDGSLPDFSMEYDCPTPTRELSFVMNVTPLGETRRGLVIAHWDISDLRKAERDFRELAMLHEAVLENVPLPVFYKGKDGIYLGCNRAFEAFLGRSRDRIIGQDISGLATPDLAKGYRQKDMELLENPPYQNYAAVVCGDHGRRREVLFYKAVFGRADDPVAGIIGAIVDVTEQKNTLRALEEIEARFQRAVAGANEVIWEWNVKTGALYLSPRWKQVLGYQDEELPSTWSSFFGSVHDDDKPFVEAAIQDRVKGGAREAPIEFRMCHKDGTFRWIQARGKVFYDVDGSPSLMAGSNSDVTDRKQAEQTVRDLVERLTLATQAAGVGIWDYDVAADRLVWNSEMFQIYGVPQAEFMGTVQDWKIRLHPDEAQTQIADFESAVRAGNDFAAEFRIVRPDGEVRAVAARAVIHRNDQGSAKRILGTNWDVTAYREALAALSQAKEQAEAANRAKSHFLASMSHELRTPLNAILGFTNLMSMNEDDPKRRQYLGFIEESGQNLLAIIQDILDLSKIEAGRVSFVRQPFDLREFLQSVVRLLSTKAAEKGLSLNVDLGPTVPVGYLGDPDHLRQIMVNLVGNAIKFTDQGSVTLGVEAGAEKQGFQTLVFHVTDTGIGIDPENLERIFHMFEQEDQSMTRKHGGAGLGLAIVRTLVTQMGGSISVASARGKGSRFSVSIPLELAGGPNSEAIQELVLRQTTPLARPSASRRILVAEDDAKGRTLLKQILIEDGREVILAENGLQTLATLGTEPVDLLLLDVQMPEIDGLEVARRVRSNEVPGCDPRLPIIAITALAMKGDRERCLAAGVDDHVSKPIDRAALLNAIQRFLG